MQSLKILIRVLNWNSCIRFFLCCCFALILSACKGFGLSSPPKEQPAHRARTREIPSNEQDRIREIQTQLNALGFNAGSADGEWGPKSRKAAKSFQKANDMKPDGLPSRDLLLALRDQNDAGTTSTGAEAVLNDPTPECEKESGSGLTKALNSNPSSVVVDCSCKELVEPFDLSSNIEAVTKIFANSTAAEVEQWLNHVLQKNYRPNLELNDVKQAVKDLNWMPLDLEIKYGELILEKRKESSDVEILPRKSRRRSIKDLYAKADEALNKLVSTLPSDQPFKFNILVTSSLEVNAEAIPGGTIFISKGALEKNLGYFVLGHELAHITKRHTTRAFQSSLIDTVDTVEDLKELISSRATLTGILDRAVGTNNVFIKYNQAQELQSDACAVRILADIPDLEPKNEVELFTGYLSDKAETTPAKSNNSKGNIELLGHRYWVGEASSHPSYPERIQRIESIAKTERMDKPS